MTKVLHAGHTSSCLRRWFFGITNRNIPMECAISAEIDVKIEQKIEPLYHCTFTRISLVKALPPTYVL